MVRIELENCNSFIYGYISSFVFSSLQKELSYKVQNCEFIDAYNIIDPDTGKRKWDGRIHLIWKLKDKYKFSTGLLHRVRTILDDNKINYKITDHRKRPRRDLELEYSSEFQTRPYQTEIISTSVKRGRGVVKAATGSGKTGCSAGIIKELGVKGVIFMAMSGDLVLQARDEFKKFLTLNGSPIEVGIVGAGICDIKDINVCTAKTICAAFDKKYVKADDEDFGDKITEEILAKKDQIRNMVRECKCIMFDEVQHASCDTVKEIMVHATKAFYRFGLSASPWRDDGADIFIDSQFGRTIIDISASFLIREKYLVKPYITFIKVDTVREAFNNYSEIYKNYIVLNKKRNQLIADLANDHFIQGRTVLILVKQIVHGKELENIIPGSVFVSGSIPAKKRKSMLDDLRKNRTKIAIATSVFDEGIDVKRISCMIMAGSGKSSTRALQRVGRTLRRFDGKDCAYVYDFMDTAKYISSHAKKRKKIYKIEKEFDIKQITMKEYYASRDNRG